LQFQNHFGRSINGLHSFGTETAFVFCNHDTEFFRDRHGFNYFEGWDPVFEVVDVSDGWKHS
jgi:hypothetical protein